jgi:signal transduction histidine kinase
MRSRPFLWAAHPVQALAEAWAIALLILLSLQGVKETQPDVLANALFFLCGAAGMWAVLRAHMPAGELVRRWLVELATAGALGAGMLLLQWPAQVTGLLVALQPRSLPPSTVSLVLACTGLGYLLCRVVAHLWVAWDRLRRHHMRWALTHAHLVLVLLAAGAGALALFALMPSTRLLAVSQAGQHGWLISFVVRFLITLFPTLSIIAILTAFALAVILPPAALFSYFAVRQTTRRLEALAGATAALRAGDYGARVEVAGEDELAQLQADFNAMAGALQATLNDLQAERDHVADLLRARRELVASVSHELRTPVATARALLEPILEHWDAAAPADARHDLEVVEGEVQRLEHLIDDLFTLARAEVDALSLQVGPVDLASLVQAMVEALAPLAWQSARVELLAELPAGLPWAQADGERLKQVLANLLRNAVRYTPPGGIVIVAGQPERGGVRIEVRDTGPGIAAGDLPHIWERFFRGEPADGALSRDGAGLGLALVKDLTEAMGGSVAVETVPGQGSCFSVWLPCVGSGA